MNIRMLPQLTSTPAEHPGRAYSGGQAILALARGNVSSAQPIPLTRGNLTAYDLFNFSDHHSELRHRIFGIGRDSQTILLIDHKLVASARIRAIEVEPPEPSDKISPLTRPPPAHKLAPCSDQSRQSLAKDELA